MNYLNLILSKSGVVLDYNEAENPIQCDFSLSDVTFFKTKVDKVEETMEGGGINTYYVIAKETEELPEKVEYETAKSEYLECLNSIRVKNKYLADTDYVISKISERKILGEDIEALKEEYKETLDNRGAYRSEIGTLIAKKDEAKATMVRLLESAKER